MLPAHDRGTGRSLMIVSLQIRDSDSPVGGGLLLESYFFEGSGGGLVFRLMDLYGGLVKPTPSAVRFMCL